MQSKRELSNGKLFGKAAEWWRGGGEVRRWVSEGMSDNTIEPWRNSGPSV